jgi:hypothetical protein
VFYSKEFLLGSSLSSPSYLRGGFRLERKIFCYQDDLNKNKKKGNRFISAKKSSKLLFGGFVSLEKHDSIE